MYDRCERILKYTEDTDGGNQSMRRTKIVCTLGPATDDENVLREMMKSGMDVARVNFSHGNSTDQLERIEAFKRIRDELGMHIALLLDTKGPEIRIKCFKKKEIELKEGQKFTLTTNDIEGDESIVSVTYADLPKDIKKGDRLLIDDGLIALEAERITKSDIICTVKNGGKLSNYKSINIPGVMISMPYISEKDKTDVLFGIEQDFDFIAASFVRTAYDVIEMRKLLNENGGKSIQIIAKIENGSGVEHIQDILRVSDGIMVARGDMGAEIDLAQLPIIQKELIHQCYKAGKKVITATQMLDSMIRNPRPTRAETTDVANAIYDGTSAIMLSGETAVGKYPVESVRTMSKIAERAEAAIDYEKEFDAEAIDFEKNVTNAISHATCTTAHDLGATAIVTVTRMGHTARMVSKYRPQCPIIAPCFNRKVCRQMSLSWGVFPVYTQEKQTTDEVFDQAVDCALQTGLVKNGDVVIITGGMPVGVSGTTNMLKVHLVGHILVNGEGVNHLATSGSLCVVNTLQQALSDFNDGDIIVAHETDNEFLPLLKRASGIIVEEDGASSHAAIVGMTLDIPVITGAKGATRILKSGTVITMDANRGLVYSGVTKVL